MALEHASEHPDERLALASREWGEELVLNLDYRLVESPEPPRAGGRDRDDVAPPVRRHPMVAG